MSANAGPLSPLLEGAQRIAVVGCGGKTTLVSQLAWENRRHRVLVMPTTKILPPTEDWITLQTTRKGCLTHIPRPGVQCLGVVNETTGKLEAPPAEDWPQLTGGYHLVLMEADGSRGLPMKGWLPHEPVVPAFCTATFGVLPITAIGRVIGAETVHNLPEFMALTGATAGQKVAIPHLAAMAAAPGGMFKNRVGRPVLLINQAEDEDAMANASALIAEIRRSWPGVVDRCFAGSAKQGRWREI